MCVNSILIKFFSQYVGKDHLENKYYQKGKKRYVLYKGLEEPSKVPPMWHAWLHHLRENKPENKDIQTYKWQKDYIPNMTGTKYAYKPKRELVSSDYTPWKPE